jgi:hypothetical protein
MTTRTTTTQNPAAPDWSRVPDGTEIRVGRYKDLNGAARFHAGAWRYINVKRHYEWRELAGAWGETADAAVTNLIKEIA